MSNAFGADLNVARRKSGLTQSDCAHLLATHRNRIGTVERGTSLPTANDIALLSLIYGKSYDALCRTAFENAASDLRGRLITLPAPPASWVCRFNRTNTIDKLEARLQALREQAYGA